MIVFIVSFFDQFDLLLYGSIRSGKALSAFPIADYIVVLIDGTKPAHLEMPHVIQFKEKHFGLLKDLYNGIKKGEEVKMGFHFLFPELKISFDCFGGC